MPTAVPKLSLRTPRSVTAAMLNVGDDLLGRPLATPARRLAAMTIDLLLIAVASSLVNAWLVAAVALTAWTLVRRRRGESPPARPRWLAPVVVALLLVGAVDAWRVRTAPQVAQEHDPVRLAQLATQQAAHSWSIAASGIDQAASSPDAAGAIAEAGTDAAVEAMATRIESLEAEVKRLRGAPPDWREKAAVWLDELGLGYGGALLYFTLVPLWWPGQTVGKRLLGLRVVELTGAPVTVSLTFKRFGGYMAGLATGGIGLAQVMWDPNAQGLQDRAARTLVLDERQAARASSIASP
jgi:hypothetical protein